ncbi:MAG: ankyrin repeat domain-containing protein, partial [Bacteroidales bacterium]|nr:ankyrin repeat domain-containing protein [Bacteroidales bacterium]
MWYRSRTFFTVLMLSALIISSCKNDGKSRTAIQTTEVDIPLPPGEQEPPVPARMAEASEDQLFREACLEGFVDKVESFIGDGTDLNAMDEEGRTGLMLASFNGHTAIVKLLLENKVAVNSIDFLGRSALMYASTGHFPETVEYLLLHGADPNLIDNSEGFTALMFAGAEGNIKVVRMLLDHGANPD